jgi:hypothetical protein
MAERGSYPQLSVVIKYPRTNNEYAQEEFFNSRNELSGVVLLDKGQSVCIKKEGKLVEDVNLGQLMLEGAKNQNEYSGPFQSTVNDFISLNQYLIGNGLRSLDRDEDDPRAPDLNAQLEWSLVSNADLTPDGMKKILTVGAVQ